VTVGVSCEEKIRLIEEFTHAAAELSNALRELGLLSVSGKAERSQFQRVIDGCKIKLEQARISFERHTAEHGC
jgi:hypothetical protein